MEVVNRKRKRGKCAIKRRKRPTRRVIQSDDSSSEGCVLLFVDCRLTLHNIGVWTHSRYRTANRFEPIGNVNSQFTYCSVEGAGVIDAPEVAVVIVNNFVNNLPVLYFNQSKCPLQLLLLLLLIL